MAKKFNWSDNNPSNIQRLASLVIIVSFFTFTFFHFSSDPYFLNLEFWEESSENRVLVQNKGTFHDGRKSFQQSRATYSFFGKLSGSMISTFLNIKPFVKGPKTFLTENQTIDGKILNVNCFHPPEALGATSWGPLEVGGPGSLYSDRLGLDECLWIKVNIFIDFYTVHLFL